MEITYMGLACRTRLVALLTTPLSWLILVSLCCSNTVSTRAAPLPVVEVEAQPFVAHVRRVTQAMELLGEPFTENERRALETALNTSGPDAMRELQTMLDARVLFAVTINPEMRVSATRGNAKPELVEQGWRQFLVKVANQAGTTAKLAVVSQQAQSVFHSQKQTASDVHFHHGKPGESPPPVADLWLDLQTFDQQPLETHLSGLSVEYRIVQLFSRDAGPREATFAFDVGQGTQDLGFRNELHVLFTCQPAHEVTLRVRDENGEPTMACFTVRDAAGRVYPSQAKRLAPDFGFHAQVYRSDGETIRLPEGSYLVRSERGPESVAKETRFEVSGATKEWAFQIERWIDPSKLGWWSGDHHIHAAGCSHYTNPTEGVLATDMARHIQGEDLKIGANLTWGPGFDYQKQFFTGVDDVASKYPYLLRYDVEVSGFGSHQ
jgi:hypothetical protein